MLVGEMLAQFGKPSQESCDLLKQSTLQGLVCFASEGRRTLVKVSSAEPASHDVEVIWDVL